MEALNLFKALSDETRLRIVFLLRNNELSVNEIVTVLGMGQSRISRHLKILSDAGVISFRKDGLWVFYRVNENGLWNEISDRIFENISGSPALKKDSVDLERYLASRAEQGREYFNKIAPQWKSIKNLMLGDLDLNAAILGFTGKCGVVADLGCGSGELAGMMLVNAERVIGVDRSTAMLEEARRLLPGTCDGRIDLRLGELAHVPVRDGETDCVVINMVLHYLEEQQQAVDEAFRILKPGGRLVIAELDKHDNEKMRSAHGHRMLGLSINAVRDMLKKAGFVYKRHGNFPAGEGLTVVIYLAGKKTHE